VSDTSFPRARQHIRLIKPVDRLIVTLPKSRCLTPLAAQVSDT